MPTNPAQTNQDERINELPVLPAGTDRTKLSVPVYNPATNLTHQALLSETSDAVAVNVPEYSSTFNALGNPPGYPAGYQVRGTPPGDVERYYIALVAGQLPAPWSKKGASYWRETLKPQPPNVPSQVINLVQARSLLLYEEAYPTRQYAVTDLWNGILQTVVLTGIYVPEGGGGTLDLSNGRALDHDATPVRVSVNLDDGTYELAPSSQEVADALAQHEADRGNPHQVTAAQLADFVQAVRAVVGLLAGNITQDAGHRFVSDVLIAGWNGKEAQGVAAALDAILLAGLLDGVSSDGNTFNKLYNMIQLRAVQRQVATIAARNALSVKIGDWVNVDDDGDGRWAIYRATSNGQNASYNKVSDPDLLNAVMSAAQIRAAYLSNSGTEEFTTTLLTKLNGIAAGATANSPDAFLLNRANHVGTQAIATVTGLATALSSRFLYRGVWAANTAYAVLDVVLQGGVVYYAPSAFTSGTAFSASNWQQFGSASTTTSSASSTLPFTTKTAAYTLTSTDFATVVRVDASTDTTITVPAGLGTGQGEVIEVRQAGAGRVLIAFANGVTGNVFPAGASKCAGQHASVQLHCTGTDTWNLAGAV